MATRYKISRKWNPESRCFTKEVWRDNPLTDDEIGALEQYGMATMDRVKVEKYVTTLDPNTPWGIGKLSSEITTVFEWES